MRTQISKLIVTGLVILFTSQVMSQTNYEALQEAFEESYTLEGKADYPGAINVLKAAYHEDSYATNLRLGWLHYLGGLFTESTAYYQKAITLKPYSLEAKFGFAYPASALGNWDQVETQYEEILKIDPQNTLALYRMGSIYYGREDFAKAEKYLEKIINLWPFDYDSMILYAWTTLKLGKFREAQVLFNKVLLIQPDDSSATEGLGMIR